VAASPVTNGTSIKSLSKGFKIRLRTMRSAEQPTQTIKAPGGSSKIRSTIIRRNRDSPVQERALATSAAGPKPVSGRVFFSISDNPVGFHLTGTETMTWWSRPRPGGGKMLKRHIRLGHKGHPSCVQGIGCIGRNTAFAYHGCIKEEPEPTGGRGCTKKNPVPAKVPRRIAAQAATTPRKRA
jgi:hypothetical protein